MSETELLDIIEGRINRHQPSDYRLDVSRLGVRRDGDWWYVVVTPDKADVRSRDYNAIMSQVEEEIEQENHVKVLLVPTLPGD